MISIVKRDTVVISFYSPCWINGSRWFFVLRHWGYVRKFYFKFSILVCSNCVYLSVPIVRKSCMKTTPSTPCQIHNVINTVRVCYTIHTVESQLRRERQRITLSVCRSHVVHSSDCRNHVVFLGKTNCSHCQNPTRSTDDQT